MTRHFLVLIAIVALGAEPPSDAVQKDQERMQGQWAVQQAQRDGKDAPAEEREKMIVKISGNKLVIDEPETAREEIAEILLDPSKSPSTIDLKLPRPKQSELVQGIYKIDGDTLTICWSKHGGTRPTEFTSKSGNDRVLFVLKRAMKK